MSRRPVLTSGEVSVLRVIAENRDRRWFSPRQVQEQMPQYPTILLRSALNRLRRYGFAASHHRGIETFYTITTTGEMVLDELDQLALFDAA